MLTKGEEVNRSPNKERSKSKNREIFSNKQNITYLSCGEKGHFQTNCTIPKRKQNHKSEDDDNSINSVADIEDTLILNVDSLIES